VAVAAPGGSTQDQRILSTNKGGGYGWGSGTSQAAAHVTGALALALQIQSHMSFEGAGLIDVEAMIEALKH
jgi:subtilisin family serine protease